MFTNIILLQLSVLDEASACHIRQMLQVPIQVPVIHNNKILKETSCYLVSVTGGTLSDCRSAKCRLDFLALSVAWPRTTT